MTACRHDARHGTTFQAVTSTPVVAAQCDRRVAELRPGAVDAVATGSHGSAGQPIVVATSAPDLLVVCAFGDSEYEDGWLSILENTGSG